MGIDESYDQWSARLAENRRKKVESTTDVVERNLLIREQMKYGVAGLLIGGFGKGRGEV